MKFMGLTAPSLYLLEGDTSNLKDNHRRNTTLGLRKHLRISPLEKSNIPITRAFTAESTQKTPLPRPRCRGGPIPPLIVRNRIGQL
jgi:hypothetical protein